MVPTAKGRLPQASLVWHALGDAPDQTAELTSQPNSAGRAVP